MKKFNCIIDTDPGVDDTVALVLALFDNNIDVKLITTVNGNLNLDTVTRNALHVLEKFNKTNIPLAKGASKALKRSSVDAKFIHQSEGMGYYVPPKTVKTKPIEIDAVEAMYKTILDNKNDINIVALGPHTNLAKLIIAHPDVVNMVNNIYCEGCAPYGHKTEGKWINYVSFNVSSDPEAFKIVIESGIPISIIPSRMGREMANFNEEQVYKIRDFNDTGKFFFGMYSGYWEPNYPDRRIATNDTCAVLLMTNPKIFKTKKAVFTVDTDEKPGKTMVKFSRRGTVKYAYKINRKQFDTVFFENLEKTNSVKLY